MVHSSKPLCDEQRRLDKTLAEMALLAAGEAPAGVRETTPTLHDRMTAP